MAKSAEVSKLSRRIEGLRGVHASLQELLLPIGNLYVAARPQQLKALTRAMNAVEAIRARKVLGTRKVLEACTNELVSLREGIFTGGVNARSKKELVLSTCSSALTEVSALIDAATKRQAYLASLDDEGNPVQAIADDDETLFTIKKNMSLKEKLPAIGSKLFVVGRAPVVVVTNASQVYRKDNAAAFVDQQKLVNLGFKVDSIDGYAVLHDQMVIGITKNPEVLGKAKLNEVLQSVVAKLSKVTQKRLALVVNKPSAYGSATWFWLMPHRELNQFATAFPGGHVKLNEWGFAF